MINKMYIPKYMLVKFGMLFFSTWLYSQNLNEDLQKYKKEVLLTGNVSFKLDQNFYFDDQSENYSINMDYKINNENIEFDSEMVEGIKTDAATLILYKNTYEALLLKYNKNKKLKLEDITMNQFVNFDQVKYSFKLNEENQKIYKLSFLENEEPFEGQIILDAISCRLLKIVYENKSKEKTDQPRRIVFNFNDYKKNDASNAAFITLDKYGAYKNGKWTFHPTYKRYKLTNQSTLP